MEQRGAIYRITTPAEAADAVAALLESARRSIDILSPRLDPALFDRAAVVDSVRALAVGAGRRARIRLLIRDSAAVMRSNHRLAALAQQLTTAMEVRRMADEDAGEESACVIIDGHAVIRWESAGYDGTVETFTRATAARMERRFTEGWERAEPDPEIRRLSL